MKWLVLFTKVILLTKPEREKEMKEKILIWLPFYPPLLRYGGRLSSRVRERQKQVRPTLRGLQSNVISLLEESIVYWK